MFCMNSFISPAPTMELCTQLGWRLKCSTQPPHFSQTPRRIGGQALFSNAWPPKSPPPTAGSVTRLVRPGTQLPTRDRPSHPRLRPLVVLSPRHVSSFVPMRTWCASTTETKRSPRVALKTQAPRVSVPPNTGRELTRPPIGPTADWRGAHERGPHLSRPVFQMRRPFALLKSKNSCRGPLW